MVIYRKIKNNISGINAFVVCLIVLGFAAGQVFAANADTNVLPCPEEWLTDARFFVDNGQIPGALIIVDSPEWGLCVGSAGFADISDSTPFDIGMRFRAGEASRLMMTTIILQLEHEKKFQLDDMIDDIIGGGYVPNGDKISIRDCLKMQTGLYDYTQDEVFSTAEKSTGGTYLPEEILFKIRSGLHDQSQSPGAEFDESDTGYLLAALVIEKTEGKPLGLVMEERIFRPLGMDNSFFAYEPDIPEPLIHGYANMDSLVTDRSFYNPTALGPARAVVSTPSEILHFLKELLEGKKLLSERSYGLMTAFANARNEEDAFALGLLERISRRGTWRGFESNVPGYTAMAGYYMQGDTYIMVLTNSKENKAVCREIFRNVLRRVSGCPTDYSPRDKRAVETGSNGVRLSWQAGFIYGEKYRVFAGRDRTKVESATVDHHPDVTMLEADAKAYRVYLKDLRPGRYYWRVEAVRKRPDTEMENAWEWRDHLLEQHPQLPWLPVPEYETVTGPVSTFSVR